MHVRQDPASIDKEAKTQQDDGYLLQAHECVTRYNNRRPKYRPTMIIFGPPIIPIEELPSTDCGNYSGAIPRDQLTSLIEICLCLNRRRQRSNNGISEVTLPNGDEDISWEAFEAYFSSANVRQD